MGRKKGLRYRCENEWGTDPCEIAKSGRLLSEEEVGPSMDGGPPPCPGKTASGRTCGQPLVLIGGQRQRGRNGLRGAGPMIAAVAGAVLVVVALVWLLWPDGDDTDLNGRLVGGSEQPPPTPPRDPWYVLDEIMKKAQHLE